MRADLLRPKQIRLFCRYAFLHNFATEQVRSNKWTIPAAKCQIRQLHRQSLASLHAYEAVTQGQRKSNYHGSSFLGLDLNGLNLVLEPTFLVGLGPVLLRPGRSQILSTLKMHAA